MMSEDLFQYLNGFMFAPNVLFCVIVLATFILEDAATIASVGLAMAGAISPPYAYLAILAGIIIGDIGLYYVGHYAERNSFFKRKVEKYNLEKYEDGIRNHSVIAVLTSRFIPGARTPTYLAMGYFGVSFKVFFVTAAVAVSLWSTGLFWGLYYLGKIVEPYLSGWMPAFFAFATILFYVALMKFKSMKSRRT